MNQCRKAAPARRSTAAAANAADAARSSGQAAYDLARFTLADMVRCGSALRQLASQSASMEEAAQKITRQLYECLRDKTSGRRCCVLVRLFRTLAYAKLDSALRAAADSMAAGAVLRSDTKCLTLLASTGDEPQWNSRRPQETIRRSRSSAKP